MFHPEYKDWPAAHRRLFWLLLAGPVCLLLLVWLLLLPHWRHCRKLEAEARELQQKASQSAWPMDAGVLSRKLQECQRQLHGDAERQGLQLLSEETLEKAGRNLQRLIQSAAPADSYRESLEKFRSEASRIDYKYLASQLDKSLRECGRRLPQGLLVLSEEGDISIPQNILHLWTVQMVVTLARQAGLELACQEVTGQAESPEAGQTGKGESAEPVVKEGGPESGKPEELVPEASVRFLPVVAYSLGAGDTQPYLLEFPVALRFQGQGKQLLAFMGSLEDGEHFLPLKQLEVWAEPPQVVEGQERAKVQEQDISVVCSAFLRLPLPQPAQPLGSAVPK